MERAPPFKSRVENAYRIPLIHEKMSGIKMKPATSVLVTLKYIDDLNTHCCLSKAISDCSKRMP